MPLEIDAAPVIDLIGLQLVIIALACALVWAIAALVAMRWRRSPVEQMLRQRRFGI